MTSEDEDKLKKATARIDALEEVVQGLLALLARRERIEARKHSNQMRQSEGTVEMILALGDKLPKG